VVVAIILFLYFRSKKYTLTNTQSNGIKTLVVFVFIQFLLGVFTLLYSVPLALGLIHQIMAFFLLSAMTFTLHRLSK
ncbi:MAG: COX15/CtaA family protein, partial [Flavobacterium sp.]